ncbi:MAG: ferritin-like domain-containing protein [Halanaerobiales bacterium]
MQFQPYQNQGQVNNPPVQVTTKDLSYIKDALSWELLAVKKCHHFVQECNDNQIKQTIEQIGRMHQNHYQKLLNHLETSNKNSF